MHQANGQPSNDGLNLNRKAIDLLMDGVFNENWKFVPTAGKRTFVEKWTDKALLQEACIVTYRSHSCYAGIGVVTGGQSGGLLALDVDGPLADLKYKEIAGDEYEVPGSENTQVTTSGRPGRRQIFYQVPPSIVKSLDKFNKLALRENGTWEQTDGDGNITRDKEKKFQELVLRFNRCMSVLPGSIHPNTGKFYKYANYNNGVIAPAPNWIMELILPLRKHVACFSEAEMREIKESMALYGRETHYPEQMIRGWFFKEEIQKKLQPRLEDLIFKHDDLDGNWKDKGDGIHRQNYCPWHGGESGTSFQYNKETGNWYCFGCGSGGDVVDFKYRLQTKDIYSDRPHGKDLEEIVESISSGLGIDYVSACAPTQYMEVTERPKIALSTDEFFAALKKIQDTEKNPAKRIHRMAQLASETGSRMTGAQCQSALDSSLYYETARRLNEDRKYRWWENVELKRPVIPNLLEAPQQTILAAAAGVGKTATCMALAVAVGRGEKFKIRGIDIKLAKGPVLWIQNDQPLPKLLADMADAGIEPEKDCEGPNAWFHVKRNWQIDHTFEFQEWIQELKPALVIIDSIGSCSQNSAVEEKDKAFASPLYQFSQRNGDPDGGFPSTSIVWIHHLNKSGGIRGTAYLEAAVDEVWTLSKPTEEQAETLRESRKNPNHCRVITVGKSRMGRQGDCLITERGADYQYTTWDWTPTERREAGIGEGQGDVDLETTALSILRDAEKPLAASQVYEEIVVRCNGLVMDAPSSKTVRRWLKRWVERGLVKCSQGAKSKKGTKRVDVYSVTTSLSRVRAREGLTDVPCPDPGSNPSQRLNSGSGHENASNSGVPTQSVIEDRCSDPEWVDLCSDPRSGHPLKLSPVSRPVFPSLTGILGVVGTRDTDGSSTRARESEDQSPDEVAANLQTGTVNPDGSQIEEGDLLSQMGGVQPGRGQEEAGGTDSAPEVDRGDEPGGEGGEGLSLRDRSEEHRDAQQGHQSDPGEPGGDSSQSQVIFNDPEDYDVFF